MRPTSPSPPGASAPALLTAGRVDEARDLLREVAGRLGPRPFRVLPSPPAARPRRRTRWTTTTCSPASPAGVPDVLPRQQHAHRHRPRAPGGTRRRIRRGRGSLRGRGRPLGDVHGGDRASARSARRGPLPRRRRRSRRRRAGPPCPRALRPDGRPSPRRRMRLADRAGEQAHLLTSSSASSIVSLLPASVARATSSSESAARARSTNSRPGRLVGVHVDDALLRGIDLGRGGDLHRVLRTALDGLGGREADQRESDPAHARRVGVGLDRVEELAACAADRPVRRCVQAISARIRASSARSPIASNACERLAGRARATPSGPRALPRVERARRGKRPPLLVAQPSWISAPGTYPPRRYRRRPRRLERSHRCRGEGLGPDEAAVTALLEGIVGEGEACPRSSPEHRDRPEQDRRRTARDRRPSRRDPVGLRAFLLRALELSRASTTPAPAVISAPARPTVGPASAASRNAAAYSRAVMFLPRICQ